MYQLNYSLAAQVKKAYRLGQEFVKVECLGSQMHQRGVNPPYILVRHEHVLPLYPCVSSNQVDNQTDIQPCEMHSVDRCIIDNCIGKQRRGVSPDLPPEASVRLAPHHLSAHNACQARNAKGGAEQGRLETRAGACRPRDSIATGERIGHRALGALGEHAEKLGSIRGDVRPGLNSTATFAMAR